MTNGTILTLHNIPNRKLHTVGFQIASNMAVCTVGTLNFSNDGVFWSLAVGPSCTKFLIIVKGLCGLTKKSDWFCCKKTSQKLKYLNFKCELSKTYFFIHSIGFTALRKV